MTNCKDCKHWGTADSVECDEVHHGYSECRLARTPYECEAPAKGDAAPRVKLRRHPRSLMATYGEHGAPAHLFTAPDFGCVHGDPK